MQQCVHIQLFGTWLTPTNQNQVPFPLWVQISETLNGRHPIRHFKPVKIHTVVLLMVLHDVKTSTYYLPSPFSSFWPKATLIKSISSHGGRHLQNNVTLHCCLLESEDGDVHQPVCQSCQHYRVHTTRKQDGNSGCTLHHRGCIWATANSPCS